MRRIYIFHFPEYHRTLAEYDLEPGWFGSGKFGYDVSDGEWDVFLKNLMNGLPWLFIHLVGSQLLRNYDKSVTNYCFEAYRLKSNISKSFQFFIAVIDVQSAPHHSLPDTPCWILPGIITLHPTYNIFLSLSRQIKDIDLECCIVGPFPRIRLEPF